MEYYAGIDVSLKESSVCVVDATGKVVREVKVASEPEAVVRHFDELELSVSRIGLEVGPLSQWLHAGLAAWQARPLDQAYRIFSRSLRRARKTSTRPCVGAKPSAICA
jgi:predicted NBD/HSP70 family sugar kinase